MKKKMHLFYIIGFALLGIGIQIYDGSFDLKSMVFTGLFGGGVCLLSKFSKERVGIGDGAMLITSGIYLGFWENLIVFWIASMGAAVVGMILYIVLKKPGHYRIPFAPFFFAGYLLILVIGKMGVT